MKRASIPASHSKALPQLDWRIPSPAMADANLGEVAWYPALRYFGHVEVGKQKDGGMHSERLGED